MVRIFALLAGVIIASHPAFAFAQDSGAASESAVPDVIERLFECRKIADPTARLGCFDQQTAAVEAAASAKDLIIADRDQIKKARRGLFGLSLPKLDLFGGNADDEEERIAKIETTIQSALQVSGGKWLVVLEDGARWLQSDSTPVLGSPKAGEVIVIERAAMGSYMAKIGKKRAFRVQRIN